MPDKISLSSLDDIEIPELEDSSIEEELFAATEEGSHKEHKVREAQESVLSLAKERIRKLEIENNDLAMLDPHRRLYSWWILGFAIAFVFITFTFLFLASYQTEVITEDKSTIYKTLIVLDKEVMMTLLATNTVQVVGLLYVVAKWLFPSKFSKSEEKVGTKK